MFKIPIKEGNYSFLDFHREVKIPHPVAYILRQNFVLAEVESYHSYILSSGHFVPQFGTSNAGISVSVEFL